MSDTHKKQAVQILDQFERIRWVFRALFPKASADPAQPVLVVAAKNRKIFESMEPAAYLGRGKLNLGGLFLHSLDKNYILLRLDAEYAHPYATVYHEYTHLQFASASVWMPLWLNEGLAEFMQTAEIRNKEVILGEPSLEQVFYLRTHSMIPLSELFKVDAGSPYYHEEDKASVFYAESWALVHFLMMTDRANHTQRLNNYISLVSRNVDAVTAARRAFGDLDQLQKALASYIRSGRFREMVMSSASAPIDESKYKAKALTQIDAEALRADVLARVGRTAEARILLDEVLKQAPGNVQAHETMGYIAIEKKDPAQALKWYAQAVKLDSQDYLAHYYFAALAMNVGDPKEDPLIESSLRTAIRLNPRFAASYDCLADFYEEHHEHLDQAHWMSLRAISLDPGNAEYRVSAANVLMSMGRYEDALAALRGAEKVAKSPADIAMVREQMQHVRQAEEARTQAAAHEKEQQDAPKPLRLPVVSAAPKHPTEPVTGLRKEVAGVIQNTSCSYPAEIEFQIKTAAGRSVRLYNNDFNKMDWTAIGFIPKQSMNPCSDFKGMRIRAWYVATPDKSMDGQMVTMELRK